MTDIYQAFTFGTPADGSYCGFTDSGLTGEASIAKWCPVYKGANGRFYKAKGDSTNTLPSVGIAVAAVASAGDAITVLQWGKARDDAGFNWTVGPGTDGLVYVSPEAPAGTLTQGVPDTLYEVGETLAVVGYAESADILFVVPNTTTVTKGDTPLVSGGALGTPASGTLTNCSGLPVAGITASTSTALGVGSVELGHASDTSITRVSAGVVAVEGAKVRTRRILTQASDDATMTSGNTNYNCDLADIFKWAALAQATDFAATGGTPYEGQVMEWWIQDDGNGPHNLTFSGPFKAGGTTLALPTATVDNTILMLQFVWLTLPTTDSWVLTSMIAAVTVS